MAMVEHIKRILKSLESIVGDVVVYESGEAIMAVVICSFCRGAVELTLVGETGIIHCDDCKNKGCARAEAVEAVKNSNLGIRILEK